MSRPTSARFLYVTNLNPTVTAHDLYEYFGKYGAQAILVCRDGQTGESLGFAFITFPNEEDGQRALEMLNHEEIDGRPCIVRMYGRVDEFASCLEVKNLDKRVNSGKLCQVFGSFGDITSCEVITNATGESQGYGRVQFYYPADAQKAMKEADGAIIQVDEGETGQPISVSRRVRSSQDQYTSVYLSHLNPAISGEKFDELVIKAIQDVAYVTGTCLVPRTRLGVDGIEVTKNLGYVYFETREVAERARELFWDKEKMKELAPELHHPEKELRVSLRYCKWRCEVRIKSIAQSVTTKQLKGLFAPFEIMCIQLFEHAGVGVPCGLLRFPNAAQAHKAATLMNNYLLGGEPLKLALGSKADRNQHPDASLTLQSQAPPDLHHPRPAQACSSSPLPSYPSSADLPASTALFTTNQVLLNTQLGYLRTLQRLMHTHVDTFAPAVTLGGIPPALATLTQRTYQYLSDCEQNWLEIDSSNWQLDGSPGFPGMNMPQRAFPHPPAGHPLEADNSIRGRLKNVPDYHKFQFLGDTLFSLLKSEDGTDTHRIVGTLLKTYSGSNLEETVNRLLPLCEDPEKRAEAIQKLHLPPRQ